MYIYCTYLYLCDANYMLGYSYTQDYSKSKFEYMYVFWEKVLGYLNESDTKQLHAKVPRSQCALSRKEVKTYVYRIWMTADSETDAFVEKHIIICNYVCT